VIAVDSSNIAGVDYDEWTSTLVIAFNSGGIYEFYRVPRSVYAGLMNASSHGKYFHANIKGQYSYRRVA
jgi:hypothetical protein